MSTVKNADQLIDRAIAYCADEVRRSQAGQNRDRQLGTDTAYRNQSFENRFLFAGQEAEESQRVLANMGVDAKFNFGAGFGERGKCGDGNQDVVADTGGFHNHLVGVLFENLAAEEGYHLET